MDNVKFFKKWNESKTPPIVVHDFYVQAWRVYNTLEKYSKIYKSVGNKETIAKSCWAIILNSIPVLERFGEYRSIIIGDSKDLDSLGGYWRHKCVAEDDRIIRIWKEQQPRKRIITYKGGRKDKPDDFVNIVLKIGKEYAKKFFNYYDFLGYEADDIAGAIYRNYRSQPDRLKVLHTVDRDWVQLVDDSNNIIWATSRIPKENERFRNQVADEKEVIWYSSVKNEYDIEHPSQYIEAKISSGDAGDNLPAGCPREYMDLVKPHPVYNIDKLIINTNLLADCEDISANTLKSHYSIARKTLNQMRIDFTKQVIIR